MAISVPLPYLHNLFHESGMQTTHANNHLYQRAQCHSRDFEHCSAFLQDQNSQIFVRVSVLKKQKETFTFQCLLSPVLYYNCIKMSFRKVKD